MVLQADDGQRGPSGAHVPRNVSNLGDDNASV